MAIQPFPTSYTRKGFWKLWTPEPSINLKIMKFLPAGRVCRPGTMAFRSLIVLDLMLIPLNSVSGNKFRVVFECRYREFFAGILPVGRYNILNVLVGGKSSSHGLSLPNICAFAPCCDIPGNPQESISETSSPFIAVCSFYPALQVPYQVT